ncbi:DUF6456 domain-containing protein [Wenxinia marina]|uniref:DUF6456 domain-containing protein n=1 Tax=Wenxinia marina DSM 24838 TaxID=1123501 RepID=A0A0D0PZ23_9RHOB|nr:DUF6456 domain-containing protein [Wenxinia marina]KIQ67634.1 hypothetical protein Wenmar_03763 [Wenxinia marina DSM 24838]
MKTGIGNMGGTDRSGPGEGLPDWVPQAARHYLAHTEEGLSIRQLARRADVHASTVLRQIRRTEGRRDDPLVDDGLRALARDARSAGRQRKETRMGARVGPGEAAGAQRVPGADEIESHAARILRRLAESGAVLAVARDMEMGVVVRESPDGTPQRTAVVGRGIAQAMALRDWVAPVDPAARIVRYRITATGRTALKELLARADPAPSGLAEARAGFDRRGADPVDDTLLRHARSAMPESPLVALARRRDRHGGYFLPRDLVAAGERLREDYELAQMGPQKGTDWRAVLAGETPPAVGRSADPGTAAAGRLAAALADLGPGLGDVVLRCCCLLEGLESLESSLGWSARSGKVVLRIALQRLRRHYDETGGRFGPMIG